MMWRLGVLVVVVACAAPGSRHGSTGSGPRTLASAPRTLRLVFGSPTPATDVANADELEDALVRRRPATASLTEIVEIRWGERTLDRAAIQEIVGAYHHFPTRNALRQRYGVDYDGVLRVVLHGYAAQLTERFGIEPREVWGSPEGDELRIGVRGPLGERVVEWRAGAFTIANVTYPLRPAPPPAVVETVIQYRGGDYYSVQGLGLAYFRPSDGPVNPSKIHRGEVLRTYREPAEYVDATGARLLRELEVTRPTPYVIARPGGLPDTKLTRSIHLVRLELDDTALGGSAPMIESATVLDGTPVFPPDLEAAHTQIWQRHYEPDVRAAERAVLADERATLAAFEARAKAWAQQNGTGPVASSQRQYTQPHATYAWDRDAKTLAVTFAHETHVIHKRSIEAPNPEAQDIHCPAGAPCARPLETIAHELELEYVIAFTASYRIDSDGRITRALLSPPQLRVVH